MIEHITSFFELVAYVADIFGLTLLVLGFARGAIGWVRTVIDFFLSKEIGELREPTG